jgi:hypothetical protein
MGSHVIDVPLESLPAVDEHAVEVDATPEVTWDALLATLPRSFGGSISERGARALRCEHVRSNGDPATIGSTLPGFVVSRSVRPACLTLLGGHRFSRYALVFRIDDLHGRARLRAETRAEFPGGKGRAYRALVIGTHAHVVIVMRILRAVKRTAERQTR